MADSDENDSQSDEEGTKTKGESKGKMVQRHKREQKELKAQVAKLLHAVPKGDKKKKQEAEAQAAALEADLKKKQDAELATLAQKALDQPPPAPKEVSLAPSSSPAAPATPAAPKGKGKQAKKKEAKSKAEEEKRKRIAEEKANTVSARQVEIDAIQRKLLPLHLTLKEVPSDGNCLYAAVVDQLSLVNTSPANKAASNIAGLRRLTAAHIRSHADEFLPFIMGSEEIAEAADPVDAYCTKLESTPMWGGQIELRALSEALQSPIVVHAADAPDVLMGEGYGGAAPLHLSYHRHYFALGEHYNSAVPSVSEP